VVTDVLGAEGDAETVDGGDEDAGDAVAVVLGELLAPPPEVSDCPPHAATARTTAIAALTRAHVFRHATPNAAGGAWATVNERADDGRRSKRRGGWRSMAASGSGERRGADSVVLQPQ